MLLVHKRFRESRLTGSGGHLIDIHLSNKSEQELLLTCITNLGKTMPPAQQTPTQSTRREALRDLPPSAKLVLKVLEYHNTLTQSELADETLLPPRTVRYALTRLEELSVVESRFSFSDARKRLYSLHPDYRTH